MFLAFIYVFNGYLVSSTFVSLKIWSYMIYRQTQVFLSLIFRVQWSFLAKLNIKQSVSHHLHSSGSLIKNTPVSFLSLMIIYFKCLNQVSFGFGVQCWRVNPNSSYRSFIISSFGRKNRRNRRSGRANKDAPLLFISVVMVFICIQYFDDGLNMIIIIIDLKGGEWRSMINIKNKILRSV